MIDGHSSCSSKAEQAAYTSYSTNCFGNSRHELDVLVLRKEKEQIYGKFTIRRKAYHILGNIVAGNRQHHFWQQLPAMLLPRVSHVWCNVAPVSCCQQPLPTNRPPFYSSATVACNKQHPQHCIIHEATLLQATIARNYAARCWQQCCLVYGGL